MDDQHYILTCIIKNKSIASWNEDHKLIIRGDCMMKLIVDENLLSFKVLEQKIFDYVCEREFDTLKSKKVLQSLETGLFFCQIFIFSI